MRTRRDNGNIEVITGCMFAGKTEELLRRLRRAEIAGSDISLIKPKIDDRFGEKTVGSHSGRKWKADIIDLDSDGAESVESIDSDIIAVDEFNFFTQEFVEPLDSLANNGQRVIVSGLDQTYRGYPFSPMDTITAMADDVTKLSAICENCGNRATKTQRIINGKPAKASEDTIIVGADESYEARCRSCHIIREE